MRKLKLEHWCEFIDSNLHVGIKTDGAGLYEFSFAELFDSIEITNQTKAIDLINQISNEVYVYHWITTAKGRLNMEFSYDGLYSVYNSIVKSYEDLPDLNKSLLGDALDLIGVYYYEKQQSLSNRVVERKSKKRTAKKGYVYLIKSKYGYKIGRAKKIKNRSKQFEVMLPFNWQFVAYGIFDDYVLKEKELHHQFDRQRINGEWFDLNQEQVESLKQILTNSNC